jgi:hypothetical protein
MNEPESSGRLPDFSKIIKYALIALGIGASALVLLSSSALLPAIAFLAIVWVLGYYLYKRLEFLMSDESETPLKDYILTKKQEKQENEVILPSSRKYVPLDAVNSDGLTQNEVEKWENITEAFYVEPKYDNVKPKKARRKKGKKD